MRAPVQDVVFMHVLDGAENLLKHVEHTLLAQRLFLLRQQLRKSPANELKLPGYLSTRI